MFLESLQLFLAHLYKSTESYCCQFDVGWAWASHFQVFTPKILYVMGKALSGELSCMLTGLVTRDVTVVPPRIDTASCCPTKMKNFVTWLASVDEFHLKWLQKKERICTSKKQSFS